MKKYKLTNNKIEWFGRTLYQIESLINFGNVHVGDKGGYIEKEENLSHEGKAWVYGDAKVYDNAKVYDDAYIKDDAEVRGNAHVFGCASISGQSLVDDNAKVSNNAAVSGNSIVCGNAIVYSAAWLNGAFVCENAEVCHAWLQPGAHIGADAKITKLADFFYIHDIAFMPFTITAYKNKNGEIIISGVNLRNYSFDEFVEEVNGWCTNNKASKKDKVYKVIIELIKIYFDGEGWTK